MDRGVLFLFSTHVFADFELGCVFQDPVPPELIDLLQSSDNPLLHQMFSVKEPENTNNKGLSRVTVVSKFKVGAFFFFREWTPGSPGGVGVSRGSDDVMFRCRTHWRA